MRCASWPSCAAIGCRTRYESRRRASGTRAAARLKEELRIIEKLGLPGFFLLHHDLLELAREVAVEVRGPDTARALLPPGRGRGSSVSSIVCYLTGLSHVDPIANELLIGRFLNEELTALPDIDLDFPRDIREVLIPRVHERYGHDRSALVAAFPTYRARGAIRELGKALGLPPGEIERVARGSEGWDAREVGRDIESAFGVSSGETGPQGRGEAPWRHRPLGMAGAAGGRGPRAPAPPLPALGRDDRRDPAADRLLPDRARGDGGAPDRAVGQGLLLGRRLPEDRSAGAGDALGGRALRRAGRAHAGRADRPVADPLRRSGDLRVHPEGRHDRGVPDREPRADAVAAAHPAGDPPGHHDPGGDRPARADPGRRGQPLHRAPAADARRPDYQVPYEHPSLEPVLRETLGTIIFQDQVLEVAIAFAGFSPGEAEGLRRAMSRKRSEAAIEAHHKRFVAGARQLHGVDEDTGRAGVLDGPGLLGLRLSQGARRRVRVARLPVDVAARPLRPRVPVLAAQRAADGLLSPDALVHEAQRRGIEVLAPDVNESGAECDMELDEVDRAGRRADAARPAGLVAAGCATRRSRQLGYVRGVARRVERSSPASAGVPEPRPGARGGPGAPSLELLAWSGACDSLVGGAAHRSARRIALWQLGVATPGRKVPGGTQLALPLDLPAPPELRRALGVGGDARRLRDDRADRPRRIRWRCCASGCRPTR